MIALAVYSFISLCLGTTISRSPLDQTSWRAPCRTRRQPRECNLFSRSRRFMSHVYTDMCNCQGSSPVRLQPGSMRANANAQRRALFARPAGATCWAVSFAVTTRSMWRLHKESVVVYVIDNIWCAFYDVGKTLRVDQRRRQRLIKRIVIPVTLGQRICA